MFNTGWRPEEETHEQPKQKPAARFSPKIVAAIHGKPLNDYARDRVFDDERPQPALNRPKSAKASKPPQKQKPMVNVSEELPVMEAGQAPEGIQSTRKYDQFKFLPTNRPVDQAHVNRLAVAIRKKNLLHLSPIVVNADLEIIDGQHRLEAARKLGISIFYVLDEAISQDDIAGMNSNKKNWALKDYIHFYAEQGNEDYQQFDAFCKKNPALPPATLLSLVSQEGSAKRAYKEGKLDISGIETARKIIGYLADFSDHTRFAYSGKFVEAVAFIERTGLYDHSHMVRKLEANPGMLQPEAQVKGWIQAIQRIYNRNMREDNIVIFLKRL